MLFRSGGAEIKRQTIYGETAQGNKAPVISGAYDVTLTIGDTFEPMAGVSAYDKEDGDLTAAIKVEGVVDTMKEGVYTLIYTVRDSEGATTQVERIVRVEPKAPNKAPVLSGVEDVTVIEGDAFDKRSGVSAYDEEDGDLTHLIQIEGEVDSHTIGEYALTYHVEDSEGAAVSATRLVTVEAYKEVVKPDEEEKPDLSGSDFGVGQGIEWPIQVNAPFVDMTLWTTGDYGINGVANLQKLAEDTGVYFFNLGFIQALGGMTDGKLNWGWGGFSSLNENSTDQWQYNGIKESIKGLREAGGDVAISLGGLNGLALWEATTDVDALAATYMDIVTGYGLTRLDLDIEGGAQDKTANIRNAKAIKQVQDATGVEIVLTLPVLPDGLTALGQGVVEAFLSEGVDVKVVNLMTMCYGPATLLPGENYGTGSLRAVDSTKDQLKALYARFAGVTLTDGEAYGKLGTTPSIGFEGEAHPI